MKQRAGWRIIGAFLAVTAWVLAGAGVARASDSPFMTPTNTPPPAPNTDAELDALQFSGLSVIGDEQSFYFVDQRTRKSFWITLNGSQNGFTVLSYDATSDQVVVQRGARQRTIAFRKPVISAVPAATAASGVPVTANTPPANPGPRPAGSGVDEIKNPQTPEQIKQAEFEARMLVSDLLEISMQERARQRALREAQARGAAPPTPGATSAPATPQR